MDFVLGHRSRSKCKMEQEDGHQLQDFKYSTTSPPTLCRVSIYKLKRQRQVPRIDDIWISISPISPNHISRFFIPSIKILFQARDRVLKVESSGSRFCMISWKACTVNNLGVHQQMDFTNEHNFTLLLTNFVILNPILEGEQLDFVAQLKVDNSLMI